MLFDFVKGGKTMLVQYNTSDEVKTANIAPYPLKISRQSNGRKCSSSVSSAQSSRLKLSQQNHFHRFF
jgi:hypothetical protein